MTTTGCWWFTLNIVYLLSGTWAFSSAQYDRELDVMRGCLNICYMISSEGNEHDFGRVNLVTNLLVHGKPWQLSYIYAKHAYCFCDQKVHVFLLESSSNWVNSNIWLYMHMRKKLSYIYDFYEVLVLLKFFFLSIHIEVHHASVT